MQDGLWSKLLSPIDQHDNHACQLNINRNVHNGEEKKGDKTERIDKL